MVSEKGGGMTHLSEEIILPLLQTSARTFTGCLGCQFLWCRCLKRRGIEWTSRQRPARPVRFPPISQGGLLCQSIVVFFRFNPRVVCCKQQPTILLFLPRVVASDYQLFLLVFAVFCQYMEVEIDDRHIVDDSD